METLELTGKQVFKKCEAFEDEQDRFLFECQLPFA